MTIPREREIFDACLTLRPEERSAYVWKVCGEDTELAERVLRLVAAHEQSDLSADAARIPFESAPFDDPTQIGPYRILERVGEGGMGIVYVAEQVRPIRRLVALKIIKLGMDTKDVIARFDSERQALALMNHPNIARILDAGATDQGRPYFVMEHVPGSALLAYCDARQLTVDERLRLFLDVCKAVDHAHQRGVIHRDLKQTNILVTEDTGEPTPKVIDFGIAKATNQRLTDLTLHTRFGHLIGTPEYMSPEQTGVDSSGVDVRTDVYSLGVVLYELLAGARPFDFSDAGAGYDEIVRVIREENPALPSASIARDPDAHQHANRRSTTPTALTRTLRGALDRIVMHALEKDRTGRYPSAAALGDDVQRFLDGAPITARAPGISARVRTLTRRPGTRIAVAFAIVATVILLWSPGDRPSPGSPDGSPRVLVLPFEFLGPADDAYLAEGISEEISSRLSGLPTLTVLGRQTAIFAANTGMRLGEMADELGADFVLDGTVRLQRAGTGPSRMRIRAALTSTASLSQIWTNTYDGLLDDVFGAQADVASRVVEAVGVRLPTDDARRLLAQPTSDVQAYEYFLRGNNFARRSELESDMRTALELYYEAGELDPTFTAAWAAVSVTRSRIRWRGYDRSELNLRLAQEAGERALRLDPSSADGHYALGYYNYYGFRDYEAALENLTSAAARRRDDPDILYALGLVHRRLGDFDAAVQALDRALDLNPRNAQVAISLGETNLTLGDYDRAERRFDQAIATSPDRPGPFLFKAWLYLASQPDRSAAAGVLEEGWTSVGGTRLFTLLGRYLSNLDWWLSRALAREPAYARMFESIEPFTIGLDSAAYYLHRAVFHGARGESSRAAAYFDSTRAVLSGRLSAVPPSPLASIEARGTRANALMWLGVTYAGLDMADSAIAAAEQGAALFTTASDALHGSEGALNLGLIHAVLGNRDEAIRQLSRHVESPAAFRIEMLRHDPAFAELLTDPRLAPYAAATPP